MEHKKMIVIQNYNNMYSIIDSRARIPKLWSNQIKMTNKEKLDIAKEIVRASVINKKTIIRKIINEEEEKEDISKQLEKIETVMSIEGLLAIEGNAAKKYFEKITKWVPKELEFKGRKKNPATDPINSMLSYGYVILTNYIEREIVKKGLNPYQGIYHRTYRKRKSLAFDLVEEFRQPVIDYLVLSLIKNNKIRKEQFRMEGEKCIIKEELKKFFVNLLWERLEERRKEYQKEVNYKQLIEIQVKKLIRDMEKKEKYKAYRWENE